MFAKEEVQLSFKEAPSGRRNPKPIPITFAYQLAFSYERKLSCIGHVLAGNIVISARESKECGTGAISDISPRPDLREKPARTSVEKQTVKSKLAPRIGL
jgi:hypothetical protein